MREIERRKINTKLQVFTWGDFGESGYPKVHTKLKILRDEQNRRKVIREMLEDRTLDSNPFCNNPVKRVSILISPAAIRRGIMWGLRKENWDIPNVCDHRVMAEVVIK